MRLLLQNMLAAAAVLLLGAMLARGRAAPAGQEAADENDSAGTTQSVVRGLIRYEGPLPERERIALVEKEGQPSDCHGLHANGLLSEEVLVGENGGLANVFVYVKKGLDKQTYDPPDEPAVLDQEGCMFRPRVQGMLVGQEFLMRNSDPVLHNVRALSFRNRPFNIAQPAESPDRSKTFNRQERAVAIQCDLHPWMRAYVFVMEHPYFGVSDEEGEFTLNGLPPGNYTLEAWHEELGRQELEVTVSTGVIADIELSFTAKEGKARGDEVADAAAAPVLPSPAAFAPNRPFVKLWRTEDLAADAEQLSGRSPEAGRKVFEEAGCQKCHTPDGAGKKLGPDLSEVAKRFQGAKLLRQIIEPSDEINKDYQTHVFLTRAGRTISGLVVEEDAASVHVLADPLKPEELTIIRKATLEERTKSDVSMMPQDLLTTFDKEEILDLLAFLEAGTAAVERVNGEDARSDAGSE